MTSIHFQGKPFNITVSKSMPQALMLKKLYSNSLWRSIRPSRTNTKKRCPFHHRGLECKSRKSRDTRDNRQVWPWSTKWSRENTNRVLPRECTGHSKHLFSTTRDNSTHGHNQTVIQNSDWLYSWQLKMEKLYLVSKKRRPGTDCGLDHGSLLKNSDLNWRK